MNTYHVYKDGEFHEMTARELFGYRDEGIWSARISTGILGKTDCPVGNRGPKNKHEVILAIGDGGLEQLIDWGFITCPVCKPEETEGFWEAAEWIVKETYGIDSLEDFTNKDIVPYDARRLDWEMILEVTGAPPNRIYLPENLTEEELLWFKKLFELLCVELPTVGYYNHEVEGHFTEYEVP